MTPMATLPPTDEAAPLYVTVAERLRAAIAAGTYPPGGKLPSVRTLSRQWDVSINTVVTAYRRLERDGLVVALPRSGFAVLPPRHVPAPHTPALRSEVPAPVDLGDLILRSWRNRDQPGMVSLGVAVPRPELLPLRSLRRHLAAVARDEGMACFGYDTVPGRIELRRAIARRLTLAGATVDPDQVVVTNGAQEALHLALRAICPPGSCVAVESPAYHGLIQAIGALGLICLEIPSSSTTGLSIDALRLALDEHPITAVLCATTFSNPGGGSIPTPIQRDLVDLCAGHGIPLIDDDTWGDLSHDGQRRPVCLAHDRDGTVVHVGSFSKVVAPGLRVGFLVPGRWLKDVQVLKITMNIATAVQPQLAIARLLDGGDYDRHRLRCAPLLAQAMQRCAAAVHAHFPEGTRVSQPDGGMVLWVELPRRVDANDLFEDAIRAKVCFTPGTLFSARKHFRHHLRLAGGWFDPTVAAAVERLGTLARHRGR